MRIDFPATISLMVVMSFFFVFISGCSHHHKAMTTEKLEPYECGTITRLHTYQGVFLASQPQPEDFEQAKMGGVKTVINMRHAHEIKTFDEHELVESLGLAYANPAWNGPDELTDGMLDQIRDLLKTADRPILLHCSSGNRVGAVWLAHRAIDGGLDLDEALTESKVVGLRSPAYEQKVKEYIKRRREMP